MRVTVDGSASQTEVLGNSTRGPNQTRETWMSRNEYHRNSKGRKSVSEFTDEDPEYF